MTDDFTPPIKSRTTDDLLKIVGAPKKWNTKAVKLAQDELLDRKIDLKKIEQAKYLGKKEETLEIQKLNNERFNFFSINPHHLFINWSEVFLFLFSWEYEKDGLLYKAKQQRKYRPWALLIFFVVLLLIVYQFL